MPTCYRHPRVETGVSCSNCGKYICPDCMTPTPVGMRCPDCAKQRTRTRSMASLSVEPTVTYALIAINALVFVGESAAGSSVSGSGGAGGDIARNLGLFGPSVASGEWYRLITSGFLHAGLFHIAFNMYALLWLGRMLEPTLGHVRFAALYLASLLAGSLGVILLSPNSLTVGASGAIFGLLGATVALARSRGIDLRQTGLVPVLVLNLAITLLIPGISIGGHLGGLVGGFLAGAMLEALGRRRAGELVASAACLGLAVVVGIAALVVANSQTPGF